MDVSEMNELMTNFPEGIYLQCNMCSYQTTQKWKAEYHGQKEHKNSVILALYGWRFLFTEVDGSERR